MSIDIVARALAAKARPVDSYPGQVATRCYTNNFASPRKQANANSMHIAREAMFTMPQIAFANWYVSTASYAETGSGGTASFQAKIQYPIGSKWQTVRWNGEDGSPVVADGATSPLSDAGVPLATPIPDGAAFLIHVHAEGEVATVLTYSSAIDRRTAYDRMTLATSGLADSTSIDNVQDGALITPCAILYPTRKPTVLICGDSRGFGFGDMMDGSGDLGEMARSIGPRLGYINACLYGDRLDMFMAGHAQRAALSDYCSHILCNYGINDMQSLPQRTADQIEADIQGFCAVFADKRVFWNTLTPASDGKDWRSLADQTPQSVSQGQRIALNDHLRRNVRGSNGAPLGLTGTFDSASVVESSLNSGKFAIGNGGQAITADGLHLNYIGYAMIANATALDTARIAR
ncbi:SGNH/GDSL hydrolase family protein [Stakelama pacifica]|uniref:Lysophospholipase L1-like esterase n=1 Tax=Stakelama pacifica TaxID=517720 RepID=A0A4R6FIF6_9SPHN|nr:hypothetical protein [Stakelama pacifica]TDN81219.1 hypothetical protein EV664_108161 [Stakelama pacifica]GGO97105.1 hypothetical protein GCM10011329_25180 [Stakelama pacifica]